MAEHGDARSTERFVWPPRQVSAAPVAAPVPVTDPPTKRVGWRAMLDELERAWLGRTVPPLAGRIAEAGWAPDDPAAFCPRCATTVGPFEADADGCTWCRQKRLPWTRAVRLGAYAGLLRRMVLEIKFTRWRRLGHDLGCMLGQAVGRELARAGADPARTAIVPVPTTFRRRLERGIDHPTVIGRGVAAATGLPVIAALERSHRPSQVSVAPSRRTANVRGTIRARPIVRSLTGYTLVVVDDVRTTGATLAAACRGLRDRLEAESKDEGSAGGASGVTIWTAVLGVTPVEGRRGGPESRARPGPQS